MQDKSLGLIKTICLVAVALTVALSGKMFYDHRHFEEVVVGGHVTDLKLLSDYFPAIKGTFGDTQVYVIDSGVPGASVLLLGSSHPEEPAGTLAARLFVENAQLATGRLFVAIHASNSASRSTRPGEGYPLYYHVPTDWGVVQMRMGDRFFHPLDSWPDPEVYVHYPSRQMLSNTDIRNHNRVWPGRADGLLAEQSTFAFMEMIREEGIDFVIDLHEAELEYPVINAIVYHERGGEIALMAQMMLNAFEFETGDPYSIGIKAEKSPPALHGLTHREIGDHSDSFAFILETAEPMLDRIRGQTGEHLLMTGQDPFVLQASQTGTGPYGLLYSPITELGWPIEVRVGRHLSTILQLAEQWTAMNPDRPISFVNMPMYADLVANGVGAYLNDPALASPDMLFIE